MTTKGNLSINQTPAYGDKKILSEFESGMKEAPISGALVPDRGPGRPRGGSSPSPAAIKDVIPEHQQMMVEMAQADIVKRYWEQAAARFPSAFAKMFADNARSDFERLSLRLYQQTPNGE